VALEVEAPPRGVAVQADEHMTARLLDILVRAAGQLTPEGGRIVLRLDDGPEGPGGSLEHTGERRPAETWDTLLAAKLDGRRPWQGYAAFGLALARRIMAAHGGTLDARPGEKDGNVLTFRFPRGPRP
jgi:signal transduction histidine kinase